MIALEMTTKDVHIVTKIKTLDVTHNLENIPHMLRNLATQLEQGEESATSMLILTYDEETPDHVPTIYGFGKDPGRLTHIGMVASTLALLSST